MMMTPQGADHTAGNLPVLDTNKMGAKEIVEASLEAQIQYAASDSLGICIFGRSVTFTRIEFIVTTLNDAFGINLDTDFFMTLGRETIEDEREFNRIA